MIICEIVSLGIKDLYSDFQSASNKNSTPRQARTQGGGGGWVQAGQIISKPCCFPPETEFTSLIWPQNQNFLKIRPQPPFVKTIKFASPFQKSAYGPACGERRKFHTELNYFG